MLILLLVPFHFHFMQKLFKLNMVLTLDWISSLALGPNSVNLAVVMLKSATF